MRCSWLSWVTLLKKCGGLRAEWPTTRFYKHPGLRKSLLLKTSRTWSCQTACATTWGTPMLPKTCFTGEPRSGPWLCSWNLHLADGWGAWLITKKPTRTLTWPGLETKMLPLLKTSKYWSVRQYWPNFQPISRQQEVCTMFEGLSKTAQAELEMQKGRRVTHFQKSLHELAELEVCLWLLACQHSKYKTKLFFFQVKHARAHAQMLRQTISAIKTEVWDPALELKALEIYLSALLALHLQSWPRFCGLTNISSYPFISNLIVDHLWRTIMVHPVPVSISIANLVKRDYEVIWYENVM